MIEKLNILSESYNKGFIGGPQKVINNTLKGLDLIGQPYVLNRDVNAYRWNWVHDSKRALIEIALNKIPAVVGPNLFVLPDEIPPILSLNHCIYLVPSQWCIDLWKHLGYSDAAMFSWPVGIDTEQFKQNRTRVNPKQVLVYFKRRDPSILKYVVKILVSSGYEPKTLIYGSYKEEEFKEILATSLFGVWITISESQGIALEEALASGCPLLVLDVTSLFDAHIGNNFIFPENLRNFRPTSVPYFDDRCGIVFTDISLLGEKIRLLTTNISTYKPTEFITENLSLDAMANKLMGYFKTLNTSNIEIDYKNFDKPFSMSNRGRIIYGLMLLKRKIGTAIGRRWT
jgi:hypothetical protein